MERLGIASDHGGYELKESIRAHLKERGIEVKDYGTHSADSVDYPDYAHALASGLLSGEVHRGIALCGTGIGISMALNKVPGIRAALCHSEFDARAARAHNDAQVVCLGGRTTGPAIANAIVDAFLAGSFEGGRHSNRIAKLEEEC